MNGASITSDGLTEAERAFVMQRLLAYARHEGKKLENAREKPLHPELRKNMHDKMTEAMRIAMKLQATL